MCMDEIPLSHVWFREVKMADATVTAAVTEPKKDELPKDKIEAYKKLIGTMKGRLEGNISIDDEYWEVKRAIARADTSGYFDPPKRVPPAGVITKEPPTPVAATVASQPVTPATTSKDPFAA
jgi:hypothetical protein